MTTTEIATVGGNDLATKIEYAKALAVSPLLPKDYQRNPGNLLFAIEYADALGIKPIHAITSIHVISGKPTASADLIAAVVRRAGHKLRITSSDTEATAELIRADDPDFTYTATWTLAKAKAAQLLSNPSWGKYPAAMLRSRAITEVARQGASDALYGVVYSPEEMGADVDQAGAPVAAVEVTRPVERSGSARLAAAVGAVEEPHDAQVIDTNTGELFPTTDTPETRP
jgi:hypothetical protein